MRNGFPIIQGTNESGIYRIQGWNAGEGTMNCTVHAPLSIEL